MSIIWLEYHYNKGDVYEKDCRLTMKDLLENK